MFVHILTLCKKQAVKNKPLAAVADNMPAHCAVNVKQFLASKSICVIHHPLYSPDLAPTISFLLLKVILVFKGKHFSDSSDIQSGSW